MDTNDRLRVELGLSGISQWVNWMLDVRMIGSGPSSDDAAIVGEANVRTTRRRLMIMDFDRYRTCISIYQYEQSFFCLEGIFGIHVSRIDYSAAN